MALNRKKTLTGVSRLPTYQQTVDRRRHRLGTRLGGHGAESKNVNLDGLKMMRRWGQGDECG